MTQIFSSHDAVCPARSVSTTAGCCHPTVGLVLLSSSKHSDDHHDPTVQFYSVTTGSKRQGPKTETVSSAPLSDVEDKPNISLDFLWQLWTPED